MRNEKLESTEIKFFKIRKKQRKIKKENEIVQHFLKKDKKKKKDPSRKNKTMFCQNVRII